jgi:hypothetical protein
MTEIIDLALLKESRATLKSLLARRGIAYFLARDGQRLFSIEKEKVDLVVNATVSKLEKKGRPPHPKAIERCRQEIRRELIVRVTQAMMRVGY